MEAPEINERKKISKPTILPMSIPPKPLKPLAYTTIQITTINNAEARTSIPNIKGRGKL